MADITGIISGANERDYIVRKASELGLDPDAVLAVAAHEGVSLPAAVGDSGTSFGPWQLHEGGALPESVWSKGPEYANAWANSQQGIDYALAAIAKVAKGQKGATAIHSIVYGFEHPANPAGEYTASVATYNKGGEPALNAPTITPGSGLTPGQGSIASGALAPIHSVEGLIKFVTSWRFAEIVGGFLLLLVGLVLVGRQFGLQVPAPGPFASSADSVQRRDLFSGPSGQVAHAETAPRARPARTRMQSHTLPADQPRPRASSGAGPGDTIPF